MVNLGCREAKFPPDNLNLPYSFLLLSSLTMPHFTPPLEESVAELTPPPPLPGKTGRGERFFGVLRHILCRKTPNPLFSLPFPAFGSGRGRGG